MADVFIYEPFLDQAIIIAKLFREYSNNKVYGVISSDAKYTFNKKYYHGFIPESDVPNDSNSIRIPTGAVSTEQFMEKGDVPLGDVYLSSNCLVANDKTLLLDKAVKAGIPIPKTWGKIDDIPNNEYPIFYKQNKEAVIDMHIRGIANAREEVPQFKDSEVVY